MTSDPLSGSGLRLIDVNPDQVENLPCCGIVNVRHEGHRSKAGWLRENLGRGLHARILVEDNRQCGYIEYLPGEYACRTVDAAGYMFIHCIWTFYKKYKRKGYAFRMVEECVADARKAAMKGVAAVARKKPWLASGALFLKCGFKVVDTASPDYELLVKKFNKTARDPKFLPRRDDRLKEYSEGLTIIRSDQCPHATKFAREIAEVAKREYGLEPRLVVLQSAREARNAPTPYAAFSVIYDGTVLSDHQISKTRFRNIMRKISV